MEFKAYLEAAKKLPKGEAGELPKQLVKKLKEDHKTKDRTISKVYAFYNKDESFSASYAAEQKAKRLGYSVGSMQRDDPRAIAKGDLYIAKWWNIGVEEADRIDGVLVSEDMRDGDVYIVIFNKVAGKGKASKKEGEDNE